MTELNLDTMLPSMMGKTITLNGDLSNKRNHLIKQFILDGFDKEGASCVITLTISASELIEELSSFTPESGLIVNDAILNERLQIIDMYSFRGIQQDEAIPGTYIMPSADDLTLLSIKLNEVSTNHSKCRIVIWPYSLLSIYTRHRDLLHFSQTLAARVNARNQVCLFVYDRGVVAQEEQGALESIVDGVIETRKEEREGKIEEFIRIKFYRGSEDLSYEVWSPLK
ncbi:MAG: hypothetical protein OEZ01_07835 [Candidatus Heimdallarchaeota archaeon]|nr:hypothetical protein [Candidatus Heimdallarchaeota archaeon]MDH5645902.1 hypothetical protein [Candidatus Heimdallarchaeota archaeon]